MNIKDSEVLCNKICSYKTLYYISMNFLSRFIYIVTIEETKDIFDNAIKSSNLSLKCNYRYIK